MRDVGKPLRVDFHFKFARGRHSLSDTVSACSHFADAAQDGDVAAFERAAARLLMLGEQLETARSSSLRLRGGGLLCLWHWQVPHSSHGGDGRLRARVG